MEESDKQMIQEKRSEDPIQKGIEEVISELVPEDKREEARARISQSLIRAEHFEGPMPPPDLLRQYEEIIPGAADRILRLTENERANRYDIASRNTAINEKLSDAQIARFRSQDKINEKGQNFAFVIFFVVLAFSVFLVLMGSAIGGILFMAGLFLLYGLSFIMQKFQMHKKGNDVEFSSEK